MKYSTYGSKNKILNMGYAEINPVLGTRPTANFVEFIKLNYQDICQSVGIPYEFTYSPTDLNNKGGDIIIDKVRAFMAEVQEILIDQFCQRVYAWVLSLQLPLVDVRPLGNENPFACTWTPPKQIGRGRNDTTNDIDGLNNGITNKKTIYGALGRDWKVETDQWLDEEAYKQQRALEKGVDLTKIVYGKGSVSLKQAEQETDSDAKQDNETIEKDAEEQTD